MAGHSLGFGPVVYSVGCQMSDPLRIAMVVEGPTDMVVIEAAISEILPGRAFVSKMLQPERAAFGTTGKTGWSGVLNWCEQAATRGGGSLRGDVVFEAYDILVIHVDADVAGDRYRDAGFSDRGDLPCEEPCPPARTTADRLRQVVLGWVGEAQPSDRTVLCVPSKSTDSWLIAALFPDHQIVLGGGLECMRNPKSWLAQRPVRQRVKATTAEYERKAELFRAAWPKVIDICAEAQRFRDEFTQAVDRTDIDARDGGAQ